MIEWRPIPEYGFDFWISDQGDVISLRGKYPKIVKIGSYKNGYKRFTFCNKGEKQTSVLLHRALYSAHKGYIPEGMMVRHLNDDRKDNRLDNLEIGNRIDNYMDGVSNGINLFSKTDTFCNEVYNLRESGLSTYEIAEKLNSNKTTVTEVLKEKGIFSKKKSKGKVSKLTKEQVEEIKEMKSKGFKYKDIAKKFNISISHANNIVMGRSC